MSQQSALSSAGLLSLVPLRIAKQALQVLRGNQTVADCLQVRWPQARCHLVDACQTVHPPEMDVSMPKLAPPRDQRLVVCHQVAFRLTDINVGSSLRQVQTSHHRRCANDRRKNLDKGLRRNRPKNSVVHLHHEVSQIFEDPHRQELIVDHLQAAIPVIIVVLRRQTIAGRHIMIRAAAEGHPLTQEVPLLATTADLLKIIGARRQGEEGLRLTSGNDLLRLGDEDRFLEGHHPSLGPATRVYPLKIVRVRLQRPAFHSRQLGCPRFLFRHQVRIRSHQPRVRPL